MIWELSRDLFRVMNYMIENNPACFIDTNILVYAFNSGPGKKKEIAAELLSGLWQNRTGCLSVQVMQEFHVVVTRKAKTPITCEQSLAILQDLSRWKVFSPRSMDVLAAIQLQTRYNISFWDSLIVRSAIASGCALLYSEDLAHGSIYEGVKVVNPFSEIENLKPRA
jgi:predicted nucleic acid-binding protein